MLTIKEVAKKYNRSISGISKICKELKIPKVGNKYLLTDVNIYDIIFKKTATRHYTTSPKAVNERSHIDKVIAESAARRKQQALDKHYQNMY